MDPLSHAIFGQTLVTAVGRHPAAVRGRAAAAVLGALAPDVDAVLMPFGWDLYLRAHAVGTHAIVGSLVIACLVALVVHAFARRSPVMTLVGPAWLGCLSHITLDVASGAQVRLMWPIGVGHVSLPLVAMAEPWLAAILVVGATALALARHHRRRAAAIVLGIVGLFLGFKGVQLARALATLSSSVEGSPVLSRAVEARWASLSEWYVFDRQPDQLRQWAIRAGGAPALHLSWPVAAESTLVARSRSLNTVRNFLDVHELGFAAEMREGDDTRVLWSDIRYCWRPGTEAQARDTDLQPVLTRNTSAGRARLACGLWFGGAFDTDGHPLRQLVKVGGWWQTRAPAK